MQRRDDEAAAAAMMMREAMMMSLSDNSITNDPSNRIRVHASSFLYLSYLRNRGNTPSMAQQQYIQHQQQMQLQHQQQMQLQHQQQFRIQQVQQVSRNNNR